MRWRPDSFRTAVTAALAAAPSFVAATARGDVGSTDPSDGRLAGDVSVVVGAGAAAAMGGARAEGELRLRYLDTAGILATYEDASIVGTTASPSRTLAAGFELRPLFLFRWLQGKEWRRARLDLALDSVGVELAATFEQPTGGSFGAQRGMQVGLGVELPFLDDATGPWLGVRGLFRWTEDALAQGDIPASGDRQALLVVTLAWHQMVMWHAVDVDDQAHW